MKFKLIIIIQFLLITTIGYSLSPKIINLVFEGAGIRGIAYAGVIQAMEKNRIAENFEKVQV